MVPELCVLLMNHLRIARLYALSYGVYGDNCSQDQKIAIMPRCIVKPWYIPEGHAFLSGFSLYAKLPRRLCLIIVNIFSPVVLRSFRHDRVREFRSNVFSSLEDKEQIHAPRFSKLA